MKYVVYAKLLGTYMPEKRASVGDCIIEKSYIQYEIDDDRPEIPVRSKSGEFHCLGQGVRNFISYPQEFIGVRTFESEYIITTEVEVYSAQDAVKKATDRFDDVTAALSLVAKNRMVKLNTKRIKRGDEIYIFEIIGVFFKKNKHLIRLKLPKPAINGKNFFPKIFPRGFLSQSKKYLLFRDPVFKKGLIYFQRATDMTYSGLFSELEIILNFVKCIELISWYVGKDDHFGLNKKGFENLFSKNNKKAIQLAGKKIGATAKMIKNAQKAWDVRNRGDIAHKDLHFNPYSRKSTNAFVNFFDLESSVGEFLVKYWKYRQKNPVYNI